MKSLLRDRATRLSKMGPCDIYGVIAVFAEDARHMGLTSFATSLENTLSEFLDGLPRNQQRVALARAYELTLEGETLAPPPIRLVYSKD